MDRFVERVHELGDRFARELPERPFERVKIVGNMAYVSGHGPTDEYGGLQAVGRVSAEASVEQGCEAARRVAVNCLGSLKHVLGSLERVEEDVKDLVFVNGDPEFHQQPLVVDGLTDLLVQVFGDRGRHARSAVGTSNLRNNQSVEVEMIVRIGA